MSRFRITWTLDVVLRQDQLWPDGAPVDPTEEDVRDLIAECGGLAAVIDDWHLGPERIDAYDVSEVKP